MGKEYSEVRYYEGIHSHACMVKMCCSLQCDNDRGDETMVHEWMSDVFVLFTYSGRWSMKTGGSI